MQKIYLAEAADDFDFTDSEKENTLEGFDLLGLSVGDCLKKTLKKNLLNNMKHTYKKWKFMKCIYKYKNLCNGSKSFFRQKNLHNKSTHEKKKTTIKLFKSTFA